MVEKTIEEQWAEVRLRVLGGVPARKACREAGLSINTYKARYTRKKKKPTDESAGNESPTRDIDGSRPDDTSTDAGGQPAN